MDSFKLTKSGCELLLVSEAFLLKSPLLFSLRFEPEKDPPLPAEWLDVPSKEVARPLMDKAVVKDTLFFVANPFDDNPR